MDAGAKAAGPPWAQRDGKPQAGPARLRPVLWAWLLYVGASAVILDSGYRLCRETDALAARWGWTRSWAGLVVLATVTSLPELFTGLSSVTVAGTPRIALGDVAGSLAFNLAILGVLAIAVRRHLFQVAGPGHLAAVRQAAFLTLVATGIAVAAPWLGRPWLGLALLPLPLLYGLVMWDLHRKGTVPRTEAQASREGSVVRLAWQAVLVVAAAGALPYAGAAIADATGLGRTFVGGLLIAASTSLPELAVTLAAWRIGAPDLAIGNLVGSNLFDVALLGIDEAFYTGPLLANVEAGHVVLLAASLAMTALVWLGLRHPLRVSGRVVGGAIVLLYVAAQAVAFSSG